MAIEIPIKNERIYKAERDIVSFAVKHPKYTLFFVDAIIDNGCPYTIISENALKRTRLPYQGLPTKVDNVPIANMFIELKELGRCVLKFKNSEGRLIDIEHDLYVGILKTKGVLNQVLPSFIGKDFLDKHYVSIIKERKGSCLRIDTENNLNNI